MREHVGPERVAEDDLLRDQKVATLFEKMAAKNSDSAEKGCKKTTDDWAKKGGLEKMVAKMAK